jgi:hypothetical protein
MAQRGRPAVTEEVLQARISDYCARYAVTPDKNTGLPPFPAKKRETPQHREWITILKAHARLRRRLALCRRCDQPVASSTAFCKEHEPRSANNPALVSRASCVVCGDRVPITAAVEHRRDPRSEPAWVHPNCRELILLAQKAGPGLLDRLRDYLWPDEGSTPRRRQPR